MLVSRVVRTETGRRHGLGVGVGEKMMFVCGDVEVEAGRSRKAWSCDHGCQRLQNFPTDEKESTQLSYLGLRGRCTESSNKQQSITDFLNGAALSMPAELAAMMVRNR
jgi:hypothetical protein